MFNNSQGGYVLPYQSRLDSLNQERDNPFGLDLPNTTLPLQKPGTTQGPLPPVNKPDPMEEAKKSDYFKANQMFMQNPDYAKTFNQLSSEAVALRDQVKKGYMPESIAQKRIQEKVFALRDDMMKASQAPQQEQQPAQAPQGALSGAIQEDPSKGIMMRNEDGSPVLDDNGQPIYEVPAGSNPPDQGPSTEELEQEAATGGLAGENQAMEQGQPDQMAQAAQAQQQQPIVDPRFMVTDPAIQAAAQANTNRLSGVGDAFGNVPQQQPPSESQMMNMQLNASGETMADMANQPKDWWSNEPFVYSSIRYLVGLLSGEDAATAFSGAGQSYQALSGMEKREQFADELREQGYSPAEIEEYIRTGNSKVLQGERWSNAGQGIAMSTSGRFKPIPGYDPDRMTPYQQAQLQLSGMRFASDEQQKNRMYDLAVRRLDEGGSGKRFVLQSEYEKSPDGKLIQVKHWNDGTVSREEQKETSDRVSEGERIRQAIKAAPDDMFIGSKGPNTFSGEERQKIGYMQQAYQGSNSYVRDIFNGAVKPVELNSLTSNMINAIVMDPKNWLSGSLINSVTSKEQQAALTRLKQIIDPVARARSGAAIGVVEMENYLGYLKNIHRNDRIGATSRVNMIGTIASLAPGTRKDMDFMQNHVLPRAQDARPLKDGTWGIGYIDDQGNKKIFKFKPGRFY